ncbi:TonB-dependent receptor [Alteromonas sp. CNT1-28]|uniref:TonB-dependent receptor domain-containing protein n=1 Tax=Alteromonas sp. CNT1-28 TaxID=2917730 RepID=UPI001447040F|nr:TonB-dependent receptor [Alteromonas sp. CNT1-28]NKX04809.1 TonB-dependent receptor [Alteromonadaceae bacterium A_SAG6]NKX18081.1 TonB-dependent receptor [Alteromonadaceae bacterium A_SAG5]NKX19296.1 TonB-dependent receptor [Alteromonadaceae bacterium A_SAG8]NKX35090.1 TonB-dependent receptor [Alteromonadaceae bacterium A_SAG3]NKX69080.1 TonB-dependent receptor [Alteromonadaceae bacterium A_SAG7]
MKTTSLNSLFGKSLLAATIALAAQPLSAQETSDASEEKVEKILVTGSLIRKGSFDTTTPVKTVDASDIEGVGAVNLGDLLGRLPSIVGDTTSASSNISEQDSGLNTVALRNLGSSRTLVLVNGQRYVSGMSVGSGYGVDLNSIPTAMIQRIDVLTGGQSAAYGSDAVAGVVNIILKKNFDGAIFDVQTGVSGEGDKETVDIEFSIGRNFDSGNVWASLGYSDDEGLMATDRDFSRVHKNAVDTDEDGILDTPQYVGSSHVRGGRIDKYNGDGSLFTRTPDVETSDAFNFQEYRSMLTPLKRMFAASGASMDLSDASRFDVTMNYSRVDSRARFEPIPLDTRNNIFKLSRGGTTGIDIATHPWFAGTTLGENLLADGITSLDDASLTFRRLYEFGDRGAENTRSTFRVAANFEHDFDNYMYLRVSATHGVTDQVQTDYGDINLERARYALDVVDDGQGGYMCADQIARISGCVPFNPFALNGISNDAVDYLSADTGLKGEVQQTVLNATLSGELDFSVTDNVMNIGFASGIEYREEKGQETPDPLRQAGIARGNQIAKTKGSFDVVDIFGELNIPIVEQLNINLAARYGDYSSVGETFNWTVNIDAPISDSFRLRGAVATAVRAPNVSDLFAGGAATSAIVTDPCNGIDAASTGNIAENCRSIDAIQRRIDNQGAFVLTQVESQNTSGLLSGSEDVGEEKADTLTAGFVFIPEQIDGLQLSVDYYNIEIDDAIAKTDRTVILNRCYSQSPSNFDPDCGGLVRRDGRTGAALDVNAASGNENKIETAGVDIDISYETELGSGDLYVAFSGNYLDKYNITGIETGDTQYLAGEILFPEIRYNLNVSYTIDKFNVYWQMRYWDETKDRNDNSLITESLNTIDAQYYNDVRFSYQFNENANTYLGVKNVFDEQPPLLTADHKYQQAGTLSNGTAYDLVGRYFYAGLTLSF